MSTDFFDKYRILAQLDHGGMSEVYLATAGGVGAFQKLLVLKLPRRSHVRDPEYLRMFESEARLSLRFNHPNVVSTYEVGEAQGVPFIAMEYLEGQPLSLISERLAQRRELSTSLALRVAIGALDGLHYAHELSDYDGTPLGLVHRDATPQNLFVTYQGQIKVVDFGIAKTTKSSVETAVGTVKGKVSYMAPEQVRGEAIDRRTDVFAMAVVLWELLSGRRLWEGLTEVAVIGRLVEGRVPDLLSVKPSLPVGLARACMSGLALDPASRPSTAREFQIELERELAKITGGVSQREVGDLVAEAFAAERQRTRAVIEQQLERLLGLEGEDGSLPSESVWPPESGQGLPLLRPPRSVHDAPTSVDTRTLETGVESAHSATAVVAPSARAPSLPRWGLVAVLITASAASFGLSSWLSSRQTSPPTVARAEAPRVDPVERTPQVEPARAAAASDCAPGERPLVELSGDIAEDATLSCRRDYLLRHTTHVLPGATLLIEPGTVLRGDRDTKGTLVVHPGGRLVASGSADRPIVFTSSAERGQRKPGDWGGVILLGKAPTNHRDARGRPAEARIEGLTKGGYYGGTDPRDSSGTLRFVRIEYSGEEIAPNNEINGLSLGGVGRGTVIDHVWVRHTADDCFEFFGGTVDAKYLVCEEPGDDAFDWDQGYTGRLQYLVARAAPADRPGSNGFEGDSDLAGSRNQPISRPVIYNATLCGKNRPVRGEHNGMLLRRGTSAVIRNSIVTGFSFGLDTRESVVSLDIQNVVFFGNRVGNLGPLEEPGHEGAELRDDDGGLDEVGLLKTRGKNNLELDPGLHRCFDAVNPGYVPGRSLEGYGVRPPDDGFFDPTANFPGAVRDADHDWLTGAWAAETD